MQEHVLAGRAGAPGTLSSETLAELTADVDNLLLLARLAVQLRLLRRGDAAAEASAAGLARRQSPAGRAAWAEQLRRHREEQNPTHF